MECKSIDVDDGVYEEEVVMGSSIGTCAT